MTRSLCAKCRTAVVNMPMGPGEFVFICSNCSIKATADYINQVRKQTMETIKSKRTLHSKIKEILEADPSIGMIFPQVLHFCEGMGEPHFRITIEMNHEDHFIDEKGQKWVKA